MTGSEWVQIVSLITGSITAVAAPFVGYWVWTLRQGVEETKTKIDETKNKITETKYQVEETKNEIKETKDKVTETIERLNGGVTLLLEETQKRSRAEGRAEAEAEAKIDAVKLIEVNRLAWEKWTKDKAVADALVLKTAADKEHLDIIGQVLVASEARQALQAPKAEAENLTEKNVTLNVSGTIKTDEEQEVAVKEAAEEKEATKTNSG